MRDQFIQFARTREPNKERRTVAATNHVHLWRQQQEYKKQFPVTVHGRTSQRQIDRRRKKEEAKK